MYISYVPGTTYVPGTYGLPSPCSANNYLPVISLVLFILQLFYGIIYEYAPGILYIRVRNISDVLCIRGMYCTRTSIT